MDQSVHIDPTSVVDSPCQIGEGTKIWHFTHIRENVKIGKNCTIGQGCYIANGVTIGDGVKIQNGVSIWEGVTIEDFAFIGPNVVFTNVRYPRSWRPTRKYTATLIKYGASIGANATILCGTIIGRNAMIGAGSVVLYSVPDGITMVGNPAHTMVRKSDVGVV